MLLYLFRQNFTFFFTSDNTAAAAAAKSLQLCLTLCDPIDDSPPGSSVPGILQARVLEWGAIAFSKKMLWPKDNPSYCFIKNPLPSFFFL